MEQQNNYKLFIWNEFEIPEPLLQPMHDRDWLK